MAGDGPLGAASEVALQAEIERLRLENLKLQEVLNNAQIQTPRRPPLPATDGAAGVAEMLVGLMKEGGALLREREDLEIERTKLVVQALRRESDDYTAYEGLLPLLEEVDALRVEREQLRAERAACGQDQAEEPEDEMDALLLLKPLFCECDALRAERASLMMENKQLLGHLEEAGLAEKKDGFFPSGLIDHELEMKLRAAVEGVMKENHTLQDEIERLRSDNVRLLSGQSVTLQQIKPTEGRNSTAHNVCLESRPADRVPHATRPSSATFRILISPSLGLHHHDENGRQVRAADKAPSVPPPPPALQAPPADPIEAVPAESSLDLAEVGPTSAETPVPHLHLSLMNGQYLSLPEQLLLITATVAVQTEALPESLPQASVAPAVIESFIPLVPEPPLPEREESKTSVEKNITVQCANAPSEAQPITIPPQATKPPVQTQNAPEEVTLKCNAKSFMQGTATAPPALPPVEDTTSRPRSTVLSQAAGPGASRAASTTTAKKPLLLQAAELPQDPKELLRQLLSPPSPTRQAQMTRPLQQESQVDDVEEEMEMRKEAMAHLLRVQLGRDPLDQSILSNSTLSEEASETVQEEQVNRAASPSRVRLDSEVPQDLDETQEESLRGALHTLFRSFAK